jgi:hypothetical protein
MYIYRALCDIQKAKETYLILKLHLETKIIGSAKHKARFQKSLIFCDDKLLQQCPKSCTMTITDKVWDIIYVQIQMICKIMERLGFRDMFHIILMLDVGIRLLAQHHILLTLGFSCIHPVPRLIMCGATLLIPPHTFMACKGTALLLPWI